MAYRKKGAKSASRRSYRRRYTRKRRYRRKFYRRYYKRFPKGTEVKSKSADADGTIKPSFYDSAEVTYMSYSFGRYVTIGGSSTSFNIPITQGTGQGQRVGNKIEPIKLRISGTFQVDDSALGNTGAPNFWQIRCLVYQVRGGNPSVEPSNTNYHQLAMSGSNGNCTGTDLNKLLCQWAHNSSTSVNIDQWRRNNFLAKCPLRRGIGGMMRVLYKKSFWINTQKNPVKQFRFITKVPKRLVFPENTSGEGDEAFSSCNNAIYVCFFFQPGSFQEECVPQLYYSYHVDFFYTDK